jgi:ferredoxin
VIAVAQKIMADREKCVGAGMCVMTAPHVFDQDDDGIVLVEVPEPEDAGDAAKAAEAVQLCPSGALSLH